MKTKIHVITNEKGQIVATLHPAGGTRGDLPIIKPELLPGQKLHEIDLPEELEGMRNAEELHKRLKEHVR